MKKNSIMSYVALGLAFALFNVIAFAIPSIKNDTFFTAYAFSSFAFVAQIPLWIIAFNKKETLKSKFLGIPVIQVGIIYLIIQLIAFAIFMIFSTLPVWLAVVVCSVILVFSAFCIIAGQSAVSEIGRVEEKIKTKRAFVEFLRVDIEMLAEGEGDTETKAALKKLADDVRFSDPMSHDMLAELEARICERVEEMRSADDKKPLINEVDLLLKERNKKCKILK